jgi:hypothetical protein
MINGLGSVADRLLRHVAYSAIPRNDDILSTILISLSKFHIKQKIKKLFIRRFR